MRFTGRVDSALHRCLGAAMGIDQRLAELGITLPQPAAPVAAYVPAVRSGNLVWTSGQLPFVDGKLAATGKVGAEVDPDTAHGLARTCALNALAAIAAEAGNLDQVARVVKVVGYVASAPAFFGQPAVVNGYLLDFLGDLAPAQALPPPAG